MIKHTVYFQTDEDYAKFKALPNKAQWLHDHLNLNDKIVSVDSSKVFDDIINTSNPESRG